MHLHAIFRNEESYEGETHISPCAETPKGNPQTREFGTESTHTRHRRNGPPLFRWELGPAPGQQVRTLHLELWVQGPRMECGEWRRTPEGRFGRGSR